MSFNYKILTNHINRYLSENHPYVSTHTDIFEHAFLRFLGCQLIPEKCLFDDNSGNNSLFIYLNTPYNVVSNQFINHLQACVIGKFSDISVVAIDPNQNQHNFCVRLNVSYILIAAHLKQLFDSIDIILADPLKKAFYLYWDGHARKFGVGLTIEYIQSLISKKLLQYPYVSFGDVWSAIVQKNTGKDSQVKFLEKQVSVDVKYFPQITLIYEENQQRKQLVLSRVQVVSLLLEKMQLDKLLTGDNKLQEFSIPDNISQFIKEKYHRVFSVNSKGDYEIDLGYHRHERKILEKYGIKEISSYRPAVSAEQSRYYIYDRNNYLKLLLALKEIKNSPCLEERWQQLIYYIYHQMWEKLQTELRFLLNLKAEVKIEIDYKELLIRLYQHAKDNLKEKLQENVFEIVEEICRDLVSTSELENELQKQIYNILFELTLMRLSEIETTNEIMRADLKKDLFIFAQKAGLEESNLYLAEIAGLKFGNTLSNNVNKNLLAVLIELAEKNRKASEEIVRLRSEIAKLRMINSIPEKEDNLAINSASHFF